ncbi:hypothetical protein EJB05_22122, partial [Eragrostis curvula]
MRTSSFGDANSFEGGQCVLLVHGDQTRRILKAWMENLGLEVWLVSEVEFLASTLEKVCHANASLARTSSDSFECRTDQCFMPRDTANQILPMSLNNSNSCKRGIPADNFLVCYLSLMHTMVSHTKQPSTHVNPDNAGTSTPGSSGAGTSAMVAHSDPETEVEDDKPLTGTHVLLVEDTLTLQMVGKKILNHLGATVEVAEDGSKAVKFFNATLEQADDSETKDAIISTPYDVILMDCQMPVMDGYEATRRIREAESSYGIHTPIIALTAEAMEEEQQKTILAGMDLHLTKPMERRSIVQAIRRVCSGHN